MPGVGTKWQEGTAVVAKHLFASLCAILILLLSNLHTACQILAVPLQAESWLISLIFHKGKAFLKLNTEYQKPTWAFLKVGSLHNLLSAAGSLVINAALECEGANIALASFKYTGSSHVR